MVSGLKLIDNWQFASGLGFQIPFSDEQSTEGWLSAHVSYEVCKWFIPLVELNWFHVLDAGNGTGNYPSQVGGLVPAVVEFEGATFSTSVPSTRTKTAISSPPRSASARASPTPSTWAPLTRFRSPNESDSLMESRVTVDLVWKF